MAVPTWLGIDIGGANIKLATAQGAQHSRPFALWKDPGQLRSVLADCLSGVPHFDQVAITMTGELADCFIDKRAGVTFILDAVKSVIGSHRCLVYLTTGAWCSIDSAAAQPTLVAAANWHALARFAGRYANEKSGLLIDIGSTTTDIIPIQNGLPAARGQTDTQRLQQGELIYTGVRRSPVCSLIQTTPYRNTSCPVAQELFATTLDVYLVLDDLDEAPNQNETADGKPETKQDSVRRLARMLCADEAEFEYGDAMAMAKRVKQQQMEMIGSALTRVVAEVSRSPQVVVTSGQGEFLMGEILDVHLPTVERISLSRALHQAVSASATAYALAVLAQEDHQE